MAHEPLEHRLLELAHGNSGDAQVRDSLRDVAAQLGGPPNELLDGNQVRWRLDSGAVVEVLLGIEESPTAPRIVRLRFDAPETVAEEERELLDPLEPDLLEERGCQWAVELSGPPRPEGPPVQSVRDWPQFAELLEPMLWEAPSLLAMLPEEWRPEGLGHQWDFGIGALDGFEVRLSPEGQHITVTPSGAPVRHYVIPRSHLRVRGLEISEVLSGELGGDSTIGDLAFSEPLGFAFAPVNGPDQVFGTIDDVTTYAGRPPEAVAARIADPDAVADSIRPKQAALAPTAPLAVALMPEHAAHLLSDLARTEQRRDLLESIGATFAQAGCSPRNQVVTMPGEWRAFLLDEVVVLNLGDPEASADGSQALAYTTELSARLRSEYGARLLRSEHSNTCTATWVLALADAIVRVDAKLDGSPVGLTPRKRRVEASVRPMRDYELIRALSILP